MFLTQLVAMYRHNNILFLEHDTCELLLARLPVARQSGHFPQKTDANAMMM